jgi:hypothetical protein
MSSNLTCLEECPKPIWYGIIWRILINSDLPDDGTSFLVPQTPVRVDLSSLLLDLPPPSFSEEEEDFEFKIGVLPEQEMEEGIEGEEEEGEDEELDGDEESEWEEEKEGRGGRGGRGGGGEGTEYLVVLVGGVLLCCTSLVHRRRRGALAVIRGN